MPNILGRSRRGRQIGSSFSPAVAARENRKSTRPHVDISCFKRCLPRRGLDPPVQMARTGAWAAYRSANGFRTVNHQKKRKEGPEMSREDESPAKQVIDICRRG